MLDTSNLSKFLKGITDAIRAKKGTTELIEHKLIDEEIASIESGISLADVGIYIGDYTNSSTFTINYGVIDKYSRLLVS